MTMKTGALWLGLAASLVGMSCAGGSATAPWAVIDGGTFVMGTHEENIAGLKTTYDVSFPGVFENETPAREVVVPSFAMDRYEVTNQRFRQFVEANPSWRPDRLDSSEHNGNYLSHWTGLDFPQGQSDFPVVFVTWGAAQAFCQWAGGRLPSEPEWEYAARAGDAREFPWGDELPSPERANYHASETKATVAVGSYPANDFGLHDLAGNVWEFLADEWKTHYADPEPADPASRRRSVRGASFGGSIVNLRTRWRDSHVETNAIAFVGFRCAYDAPPTTNR